MSVCAVPFEYTEWLDEALWGAHDLGEMGKMGEIGEMREREDERGSIRDSIRVLAHEMCFRPKRFH